MNSFNLPDLLNEHAYLSENLRKTQERIAKLQPCVDGKSEAAANGRRPSAGFSKLKNTLERSRKDEARLLGSITDCVNKVEAVKQYQSAVAYSHMAPLSPVSLRQTWVEPWSNQACGGWYTAPYPPNQMMQAPLVVEPIYADNGQVYMFAHSDPTGIGSSSLYGFMPTAASDLTLPAYPASRANQVFLFSPAFTATAPEFSRNDPGSDGMASLSLSVDETSVEDASPASDAESEPRILTEHTIAHTAGEHPPFHRPNKPPPLTCNLVPAKSIRSTLLSPEDLISPKTVLPRHRRRYSEDVLSPSNDTSRKFRFDTSAEERSDGAMQEPVTPMKGHRRGAKSDIPRALKKLDAEMCEEGERGYYGYVWRVDKEEGGKRAKGRYCGEGDLVWDCTPGKEVLDDVDVREETEDEEGQGIAWSWAGKGMVWPKTPLVVGAGRARE